MLAEVRANGRALAAILVVGALGSACSFPEFRFDAEAAAGLGGQAPGGSSAQGGQAAGGSGSGGGGESGGGSGSGSGGAGALGGVGGSTITPPEPGSLDGDYHLISLVSSKCMDVGGTPTFVGNPTIQQLPCAEVEEQSFTMTHVDAGYYTLHNPQTDTCVAVEGGAADNSTPLVSVPCDGTDAERWLPVPQEGKSFLLVNAASGKCADVPGFKSDDGLGMQQWVCNADVNQRWLLASLTEQQLPLTVDEFFVHQIWDDADEYTTMTPQTESDTRTCSGERAPGGRGDCHRVTIDSFPSDGLARATWLYPAGNWGGVAGLRIEPDATVIHFQARGEVGGEVVSFAAGGPSGNPHEDAFDTGEQSVTLTTEWEPYSLTIPSADYSAGVLRAFHFTVDLSLNTAPMKFYVDDIVWE